METLIQSHRDITSPSGRLLAKSFKHTGETHIYSIQFTEPMGVYVNTVTIGNGISCVIRNFQPPNSRFMSKNRASD
jgi:hypothetical protein